MDYYYYSRSIFAISLFLLSWANQGTSDEAQAMDQLAKNVEGNVAGFLQQAEKQTAAVQGEAMPCVQKLIPCQAFMKSPSPPPTCCTPLQDLVKTDSQCLCKVLNNADILKGFNITPAEATALPKNCGLSVDVSDCKTGTSPTASPTTPSSAPNSSSSSSNNSSESGSSSAGVRITHGAVAFPYWFSASVAALMYSTF